jgi:hypothetical protein
MKLNFWQWLGIILVLLGGAFWWYERSQTHIHDTQIPAPTTQPR